MVLSKWPCSVPWRDQLPWETTEEGELMKAQLGSGRGYGQISSTSDKPISKEELLTVYDGFTGHCVCVVD